MSDLTLGTILDGAQQRDAIHVAIAPVIAHEKLAPGQDIGFLVGGTERVGVSANPIGIVDPFLKHLVFPDQRLWMMLYPRTITSLRHDWTHPAFGQVKPVDDSERWLREFAEECGLSYGAVMEAARGHIESGDYVMTSESARDLIFEKCDEFWVHFEIVEGEAVGDGDKTGFFSCSC